MITVYYLDISTMNIADVVQHVKRHGLNNVLKKSADMGHELTALHYLTCEMLMRSVCSMETGISFGEQSFLYNEHGKPQFANIDSWYFNKSHSRDRVVVATSDNPVGVDIEKISGARMNVANRYFSAREINMLEASYPEHRDQLFYQLWTAREAYLKYLGTGISYGLEKFRIKKNSNGIFEVNDPRGSNCDLVMIPLSGLYQIAVCGAIDEEVTLQHVSQSDFHSRFTIS